ncbi:unnamed protein product [Moneuplotes crassus]|uniref:Uncharacterized protein n=1 Tax=Euplotes crassus TaxID=5936 RepID=A0AAD2CZD7_EUPCR|nr:unnamed protein product [Moneuplotes crassus]
MLTFHIASAENLWEVHIFLRKLRSLPKLGREVLRLVVWEILGYVMYMSYFHKF